jgi:hypothetical protein
MDVPQTLDLEEVEDAHKYAICARLAYEDPLNPKQHVRVDNRLPPVVSTLAALHTQTTLCNANNTQPYKTNRLPPVVSTLAALHTQTTLCNANNTQPYKTNPFFHCHPPSLHVTGAGPAASTLSALHSL